MTITYDVATGADSSAVLGTGTGVVRYGIELNGAGGLLVGTVIATLTVYLLKGGSPSGNITATVRNSADTVVATATETPAATSLTTSYLPYTFTFASPPTLANGDRIQIEYGGAASITIEAWSTDHFDTSVTRRTRFTTVYSSSNTTDITGKISTGTFISQTYTHKYNIRKLITQTFTHLYKIRKLISQSYTHLYKIRKLATQTYTHLYKIRKLITQSYTHLYKIRQLATQTYTHKYNIRQLASKTFTHIYNILEGAALTTVNQTYTHIYKIRQLASQTFTHLYKINLFVPVYSFSALSFSPISFTVAPAVPSGGGKGKNKNKYRNWIASLARGLKNFFKIKQREEQPEPEEVEIPAAQPPQTVTILAFPPTMETKLETINDKWSVVASVGGSGGVVTSATAEPIDQPEDGILSSPPPAYPMILNPLTAPLIQTKVTLPRATRSTSLPPYRVAEGSHIESYGVGFKKPKNRSKAAATLNTLMILLEIEKQV